MMLYEQLGSRWPVLGSPLVAEGRVCAIAGLLNMLDGVCAVAADAVSGEILWEHSDWADAEVVGFRDGRTFQATGQFCWDDQAGELVFSGGDAPPVRLSPVNGAARAAYARGHLKRLNESKNWKVWKALVHSYSQARGQDIGKFGRDWMVLSGRRMLIDQSEGGTWRQWLEFLHQDETGDGRFPLLQALDCVLMPSWDESDVLFMAGERKSTSIALVSREKLMAALEAGIAEEPDGGGPDSPPPPPVDQRWMLRRTRLMTDGFARWRSELPYQVSPVGCVLAGDAALVLTCLERVGEPKLAALDRVHGKELWHVDLPSAPVYDGLAVADDGRVIVALRDGSVICLGRD
jgi:hypothetical protein